VEADYDRIAAAWAEHRVAPRPGESDFLELLLESLPTPGEVLDLGCGHGRPNAERVLAAGHALTGIDASAALLDQARARFPHATWRHGKVGEIELGGPYDGAICWDLLFHLPREHQQPILARLMEVLRPGALLILTSGGSAQRPFSDTMFGESFDYDAHPPERLREILTGLGFRVLRFELLERPTGGRNKGRLGVALQRP